MPKPTRTPERISLPAPATELRIVDGDLEALCQTKSGPRWATVHKLTALQSPAGEQSVYGGPVEVGMKFIWMPGTVGEAQVEVIKLCIPVNDELRVVTKTIVGSKMNPQGQETWNDISRFREACVPLPPAPTGEVK